MPFPPALYGVVEKKGKGGQLQGKRGTWVKEDEDQEVGMETGETTKMIIMSACLNLGKLTPKLTFLSYLSSPSKES